jgi:hypothetical protein
MFCFKKSSYVIVVKELMCESIAEPLNHKKIPRERYQQEYQKTPHRVPAK